MKFTPQEGSALYGLLAGTTTDIILKTDRDGYVLHASSAFERLGFRLPNMLIGPHILDLVHPSHAAVVKAEHEAAIHGRPAADWVEFLAQTVNRRQRWFAIQIRPLADDDGTIYGALGIMRCIEDKKTLEEQVFTASLTDPLTGLTNRKAFVSMLEYLVDARIGGFLALFKIDHFKALNMQYGHAFGDRVLVFFADLLRMLTGPEEIISRVGGENLGVLLPGASPNRAAATCEQIVSTLAEIPQLLGDGRVSITASAGVAPIAKSLDETIKRAELALFLAKAKGCSRVEMDRELPVPRVSDA